MFNEANTVEAFVSDRVWSGIAHDIAVGPAFARRHGQISELGWHNLGSQNLPLQPHEFFEEAQPTASLGPSSATCGCLPLSTIGIKGSSKPWRVWEGMGHA